MKTLVCDICGFRARTRQGLTGHRRFKHQLADRYAHARELAGSVELLTKEKTEMERSVSSLRDVGLRLTTENAALESKKAGLQKGIEELGQIASTKAEDIAASWRQGLIQAGWIPPGTVQPETIVLGEIAKQFWGAVVKKA